MSDFDSLVEEMLVGHKRFQCRTPEVRESSAHVVIVPDRTPPATNAPGAIRLRPKRELKVNKLPEIRNTIVSIGDRRERLTVTGYGMMRRHKSSDILICRCDCGTTRHVVPASAWRGGNARSCGCLGKGKVNRKADTE